MTKTILVVEDDRDISELVRYGLAKEGYAVSQVYDGLKAVESASAQKPDMIILDLMLPSLDGLEVCRQNKQDPRTKHVPVIMLTAKGEESDIVIGLQMGADDYIPKPFSPKVLLARIRAVFRRSGHAGSTQTADVRVLGDVVMDLPKRKVTLRGKATEITSLEFDILEFLSRSPGRVFTREQLLENVWKEGRFIVDRAVDVHILGLRKKLGAEAALIETVRGVGYRLRESEGEA